MFDKTDFIRILDVILIGPLMIYGAKTSRMPEGLKMILYASGVGTILYNGYNLILSPLQNVLRQAQDNAINKNNLPASR